MNRLPIAYVGYHGRSCVTARELARKLNEIQAGGFRWRRIGTNKKFKYKPVLFLRWGNSTREVPDSTIEIQPQDGADYAATKFKMMQAFIESEDVPHPPVVMNHIPAQFAQQAEDMAAVYDTEYVYIRGAGDSVRYAPVSQVKHNDRYVTMPLDRDREFRVHIFNGKTIGVYEKIPHQEGTALMKSHTCQFKRLDMGNDRIRKELNGVRPAAKAAVEALGMLFGGVDVIRTKDGRNYVTEVNSAPSLNTPNLDRWASELDFYIREQLEPQNNQQEEEDHP